MITIIFGKQIKDDLGEAVVGAVKDEVADVALLDPCEPLVHVRLPHSEAVHDGAVLVLHKDSNTFCVLYRHHAMFLYTG